MVPQLRQAPSEVSPEIKQLRRAVIDAITSCQEPDDEAVWLELLGFMPEWYENFVRSREAKLRPAPLTPWKVGPNGEILTADEI